MKKKKRARVVASKPKKEIIRGEITTQRPVSIFDWVNCSLPQQSPASLQIKFTIISALKPTWVCVSTSVQYVDEPPTGTVAMLITVWDIQDEHQKGQSLT